MSDRQQRRALAAGTPVDAHRARGRRGAPHRGDGRQPGGEPSAQPRSARGCIRGTRRASAAWRSTVADAMQVVIGHRPQRRGPSPHGGQAGDMLRERLPVDSREVARNPRRDCGRPRHWQLGRLVVALRISSRPRRPVEDDVRTRADACSGARIPVDHRPSDPHELFTCQLRRAARVPRVHAADTGRHRLASDDRASRRCAMRASYRGHRPISRLREVASGRLVPMRA